MVSLSWKVKVLVIQYCPTLWNPWTVAHWAPLSMGFSRQGYWSGSHSLLQRIFLTQGLNLGLLHCRQMFNVWATREAQCGSVINSLYFAELCFLYTDFVENFYSEWAQTVVPYCGNCTTVQSQCPELSRWSTSICIDKWKLCFSVLLRTGALSISKGPRWPAGNLGPETRYD